MSIIVNQIVYYIQLTKRLYSHNIYIYMPSMFQTWRPVLPLCIPSPVPDIS